jgi:hypothetical protein
LQEQKALQHELFGPLQPLSVEEYMGIYQTTGIDIDGRRDFIQHEMLHHVEEGIKRFVSFVKAIPVFSQLSINDQTALIKGESDFAFVV